MPVNIVLGDDVESSPRPMTRLGSRRNVSSMKGGAMSTYSIHHFSVAAMQPVPRPKGARRIAMSSLAASVANRSTLLGNDVRRAA